jgi:hypothetical protein
MGALARAWVIAADVSHDAARQSVTIALWVTVGVSALMVAFGVALAIVRRRRPRRRDIDW